VPLDSVALVINLDMIGRLEGGQLTVELTSRARRFRSVVDSLAGTLEMSLRYSQVTAGRSDHSSFSERGVPAMALFTGFHGDYHRTTDTADKLDYTGIDRIVDLAEAIIRAATIH
jgi:Zn-dependent M28 family amino/carboxypeptidase